MFPCRWMAVVPVSFPPCVYNSFLWQFFPARLRPLFIAYSYGMDFNYFPSLSGLIHTMLLVWHNGRVLIIYRGVFCWGPPLCCSTSTTLINVDTDYSMLISILWNLIFLLLSSSKTLLMSWVMPLSITVNYTWEFRRLATSRNMAAKLADNEVVSTGSRYSSTIFQSVKGMSSSSSVPHESMDAYNDSIFYRIVASPSYVGNLSIYSLFLSFPSLSVSTILTSSATFDGGLPDPQCWPSIWRWWITVLFSNTILSVITLPSLLFCVSRIFSDVVVLTLVSLWNHHIRIELISQNSTA